MTEQYIVTMMDNNLSNIFPTKLSFDNENNTLNKTNENNTLNKTNETNTLNKTNENNTLNKTNETNTLNKTNTNLYYGIKWLTGC
jgi:hypothetical protein